jgi:hypothetical protein
LERRQAAAATEVPVRDFAVSEPYGDQPGLLWLPQAQLLNCQGQFLVLVALDPGKTAPGKAGDEGQGITCDRPADLRLPFLTWPQV